MKFTHDLPFVVVEWDDAWVKGDIPVVMSEVAHDHKPMVITTAGWVLRDDATGIQLTNEYYEDAYRGRTFIPRAMVRKVTPLKLSEPRRRASERNSTNRHSGRNVPGSNESTGSERPNA